MLKVLADTFLRKGDNSKGVAQGAGMVSERLMHRLEPVGELTEDLLDRSKI